MPRGGKRPGAGRPIKPLADKLLDGNPGKRELTVIKFDKPKEPSKKSRNNIMSGYFNVRSMESVDTLPTADVLYKSVMDFISGAGCADIIAPYLIEDFVWLRLAYIECEYKSRLTGRVINGDISPYVRMSLNYHKEMLAVYNQIWLIIAQNSEEKYEGKNEFLEMLAKRGF